ncbi:MAG: hypothetical protein ACFFCE_16730 [Promethearchaeota archaeon]
MSRFFGFPSQYIPTQRIKEYAKKAIAVEKLNVMKNSVKNRFSILKEQHLDIIKELNNVENEIIKFINLYRVIFNPKLTPHSQIKDYHPNLDFNYFADINTIEKAYWLGFLFADGWIAIDIKQSGKYFRIGFGQKSEDKERVVAFCKALGLNKSMIKDYNIYNDEGKVYHYSEIRFLSGNVEWENSIANQLINWGMDYDIGENGKRIKILIFPTLKNEKLMLAFLLGFYDGDGSLRQYTSPQGKIKVSPHICSINGEFLEKIRIYYQIKNNVFLTQKEKFDYETGKIKLLKLYGLTLGPQLFHKMMSGMNNSMKRKRALVNSVYITSQRNWLLKVLPKEKIEKILKILPTYRIADLLGLSPNVIKRFVKNVYNLEIPIRRDVSEYKLKYWMTYFDKIGKYPNI